MSDESVQRRHHWIRGYSDRAIARDSAIEDRVLAEISGDPITSRRGAGTQQEDRSPDPAPGRPGAGSRSGHPSTWEQRGGYTPNPRGDGNHDDMQERNARGFLARAGDEVAGWLGSDAALRRRRRDAWLGDPGARHHIGRGPRNYVRADGRIAEEVNDRLTDDPLVDASDVTVTVAGGEVTLSGTVDSRPARRRAEDLAWAVPGVTQVQNNIRPADRTGGR